MKNVFEYLVREESSLLVLTQYESYYFTIRQAQGENIYKKMPGILFPDF